MKHLFSEFLADDSEYARAELFWLSIWEQTSRHDRVLHGWKAPWFPPQAPKDANPIFSAVSISERKGIRIIQYEPTSKRLEVDFWMDTFGGSSTDPNAIRELVVACALSVESSQIVSKLMSSWIVGDIELVNTSSLPYGMNTIRSSRPRSQQFSHEFEFGNLTPAA